MHRLRGERHSVAGRGIRVEAMDNVGSTTLGRIEGKLDLLTYQIGQTEQRDADKEKRLRTVEKWMYALPPTLFLGVVNIAASVLLYLEQR